MSKIESKSDESKNPRRLSIIGAAALVGMSWRQRVHDNLFNGSKHKMYPIEPGSMHPQTEEFVEVGVGFVEYLKQTDGVFDNKPPGSDVESPDSGK